METKTVNQDQISTNLSSVIINRQKPTNPISETDLENYCVESVWRLFNRYRASMAKKNGISELNVILIDAKIIGVKIDGYKVINPEGFTGKELEISILITVGTKQFNVAKFSDNANMGSAISFMLREGFKDKSLMYAEIGERETSLFLSTPAESKMIGRVNWGREDVSRRMGSSLGASSEVAELILKRAVEEEISLRVLGKIKKSIYDGISAFISEISKISNLSEKLEINRILISSIDLPEYAYAKKFLFMGKRVKMIKADERLSAREFVEEKERPYMRFNELIRHRIKWATR